MTLSRAMKLFGTEEPVPETHLLRAGPLEATLDAANLPHISLYGVEAIRAISFIVRDRNWGTYDPEIADLAVEESGGGFTVTYRATCRAAEKELRYDARITGSPDGALHFAARGQAVTDFLTARAGFVVLHPV